MKRDEYTSLRGRKWIVTLVGFLLGAFLGLIVPDIWDKLGNSLYDRSAIEAILRDELIGEFFVDDAVTSEVCIVAYDYNSQKPRFYSKYFANKYPAIFNVTMANATAGSSAAPAYFAPNYFKDLYGTEQLIIDGGIIANNPALYANLMARYLLDKQNVRIISFSTGTDKDHEAFSKTEISKLDMLSLTAEFLMNIETFNTANMLQRTMAEDLRQLRAQGMPIDKQNYYRCDSDSLGLQLDSVDPDSISKLLNAGQNMWNNC